MSKMTLPVLLVMLSACSPGSFSNSPADPNLKKPVQYRVMQSKCSSLQLRDSELGKGISAHDFRALLSCFNSKGDLDSVEKVTQELSDAELEVVLIPMNKSLLGSANDFNSIQKGYELLSKWGLLNNGFKAISEAAKYPTLIRSGAEILMASGKPNAEYIQALQLLSSRFSEEGTKSFSGAALALVQSPAWRELVNSLKTPSLDTSATSDNQARSVRGYLLDKKKNPKTNLFQTLLQGLADQSLFKVTDQMLGKDLTEMREGISEVSSVLRWSFKEQKEGRYIDQALDLFRFADRPVECFKKSIRIEDPISFFVSEVSRQPRENVRNYLQVQTPQNLVGVIPFCDVPEGINQKYQNFLRISYLPELERAHSCIIQAFQKAGRFDLLRGFLVDPKSVELLPSLSRLNVDRAWEDLFLITSSIRPEDRASVADMAQYLSVYRPELGEKSIFEVLLAQWADADEKFWIDVFSEIASLGSSNDNTIEKLLSTARALQFASDRNPLVLCLKHILESPELAKKWFSAAVKLERSSHYSFALTLLSQMAVDGRLQEIVDQTLRLFSRLSDQATVKIDESKQLPAFNLKNWLRHQWSSKDIPLASELENQSQNENECFGVNIEFNLFDSTAPNYSENFERLKKCFGKNWTTVFDGLQKSKTALGGNYFDLGTKTLSRFNGSTLELRDFLSRWTALERSGDFESLLKVIPVFLKQTGFKESISNVLEKASTHENRRIQNVFKKTAESIRALDRKVISNTLKSIFKEYDSSALPEPTEVSLPLSLEKTKKGIVEQECLKDATAIDRRAREVLVETENAIATPVLIDGKPRTTWKPGELKSTIQGAIKNLNEPMLRSVVSFIEAFSLKEGEAPSVSKRYLPKELFRWLKQRSNDYRMISYYYPGEKKPRVKWVNTVDALELLVANVDFNFITRDNYGLKFFGQIAQAWGDEPESLWPEEIFAEYKRTGKRPATTAEVYAEIEKMLGTIESFVGYPKLPKCGESLEDGVFDTTPPSSQPKFPIAHFVPRYVRAAIFNLKQLLPVVHENIVGSGHEHDGGIRLIRDLFYSLRSTTPIKARSPKAGEANHLSLVPKIVNLGLLHEVTKLVRSVDQNDADVARFIEGLVYTFSSQELYLGLKRLMVDDKDHRLILRGLDLAETLSSEGKIRVLGQLVFYGLGSVQNLGIQSELAKEMSFIIEKHDQAIADHLKDMGQILTDVDIVKLMAALSHQSVSSLRSFSDNLKVALIETGTLRESLDFGVSFLTDADMSPSIDALRSAIQAATQSSEYRSLNLKQWRDRGLDFLGEEGLAQRVTEFSADLFDSGIAYEWLAFAARNPNAFESLLESVGDAVSSGRTAEFFGLVQRAIDSR